MKAKYPAFRGVSRTDKIAQDVLNNPKGNVVNCSNLESTFRPTNGADEARLCATCRNINYQNSVRDIHI